MSAPDFNGTYPSAGKIIGPLWQAMWVALADGRPRCGLTLAEEFAPRFGAQRETAQNLLRQARAAGLLETELRRRVSGQRTKWYRRKA